MEPTIFAAFSYWAINGVVSGVVANITYDGIKSLKGKFKTKMAKYFNDDDEIENYLKAVVEQKVINIKKPYRDIEDVYEIITKRDIPEEFSIAFKEWVKENKSELVEVDSQVKTINVQSQSAARDIINIQGNSTINNYGDKGE